MKDNTNLTEKRIIHFAGEIRNFYSEISGKKWKNIHPELYSNSKKEELRTVNSESNNQLFSRKGKNTFAHLTKDLGNAFYEEIIPTLRIIIKDRIISSNRFNKDSIKETVEEEIDHFLKSNLIYEITSLHKAVPKNHKDFFDKLKKEWGIVERTQDNNLEDFTIFNQNKEDSITQNFNDFDKKKTISLGSAETLDTFEDNQLIKNSNNIQEEEVDIFSSDDWCDNLSESNIKNANLNDSSIKTSANLVEDQIKETTITHQNFHQTFLGLNDSSDNLDYSNIKNYPHDTDLNTDVKIFLLVIILGSFMML